jgi:predicted ABC-type ATPase
MKKEFDKYIKEDKEFSIETTLAGTNAIKQMRKAKEMGYEITMVYVALSVSLLFNTITPYGNGIDRKTRLLLVS